MTKSESLPESIREASGQIVTAICDAIDEGRPLLVGIDGPSGSGKSTIASIVARELSAVIVRSDDFFAASIPDQEWAARSPRDRANDCIDWRRLRTEALEPLLEGRTAKWHPFDFLQGALPDGSYEVSSVPKQVDPRPVIIVEGAYSCRPELRDLIALRVLVDASSSVRRARLQAREDAGFLSGWHALWDSAEEFYFEVVSPASDYDLVVRNE